MGLVVILLIAVGIIVYIVVDKRKQAEKREKEEILRKQQEEESEKRRQEQEQRKKEEEEKWQEDIRTGKVDINKAKDLYNAGTMFLNSGKYNEAITQFTKAIEFNPRLNEAYFNRGLAYYKNGDFDKAIDDYNKMPSLNNNDVADKLYNLGLAYMGKEDYDNAYWKFRALIGSPMFYDLSESKKIGTYISCGISKYNEAKSQSDLCEGVGYLIDALEKDPNNSEAKRLIRMAMQNSRNPTLNSFIKSLLARHNLQLDGYEETSTMAEEAQDE